MFKSVSQLQVNFISFLKCRHMMVFSLPQVISKFERLSNDLIWTRNNIKEEKIFHLRETSSIGANFAHFVSSFVSFVYHVEWQALILIFSSNSNPNKRQFRNVRQTRTYRPWVSVSRTFCQWSIILWRSKLIKLPNDCVWKMSLELQLWTKLNPALNLRRKIHSEW